MSEKELNRWIKRIALLFVVVLVAFIAIYAVDRFRMPAKPIPDQRIAALEEKVRANPADVVSRGSLADLYEANGRHQEAIDQYTAIINSGQAVEVAKAHRAVAYLALDQLDLAEADYKAVVEIAAPGEMANVDPMLEAAYYGLGDIALRRGNAAESISYLEKALVIKKTDSDALLLIGKAHIAAGDYAAAAVRLRQAVQFVPIGWAEPYELMADAYTKAGEAEEAAWAAAMVTFQKGDAATATTALMALVNGKAALDAYVGLGLIAESAAKPGEAREWYSKAIAINPDNAEAKLGLGRVGGLVTPAPSASGSN
jgi:tetratricopeptide (TPR) repeat protein